jgi:hypothetical protein
MTELTEYNQVKKLCELILSEDTKIASNKAASARVRGYINEIRKHSVGAKRELVEYDKSYSKKKED